MILKVFPYTASVSESTSTQPAQAEDTAGTAGVPITLNHARLTGYWPLGPLETICFPSMGMMNGQNHSLCALGKSLIFSESQFPSGHSEGSDPLCFWRLLSRFHKLGRAPAGGWHAEGPQSIGLSLWSGTPSLCYTSTPSSEGHLSEVPQHLCGGSRIPAALSFQGGRVISTIMGLQNQPAPETWVGRKQGLRRGGGHWNQG